MRLWRRTANSEAMQFLEEIERHLSITLTSDDEGDVDLYAAPLLEIMVEIDEGEDPVARLEQIADEIDADWRTWFRVIPSLHYGG